ncbi:MAG: hypothetical protein HY897_09905 [Deltaproteobacteria bacterium]|nr:hypothetical protein [Deltaproteobacteria bacterium]
MTAVFYACAFAALVGLLLSAGCSADKAIEKGTNCTTKCPVGTSPSEDKSATGVCEGSGGVSGDPLSGSGAGGGRCIGTGKCSIYCTPPKPCCANEKWTESSYSCDSPCSDRTNQCRLMAQSCVEAGNCFKLSQAGSTTENPYGKNDISKITSDDCQVTCSDCGKCPTIADCGDRVCGFDPVCDIMACGTLHGACETGFVCTDGECIPEDHCESDANCADAAQELHVIAKCKSGVCVNTGCAPGWSDTDNNLENGCEKSVCAGSQCVKNEHLCKNETTIQVCVEDLNGCLSLVDEKDCDSGRQRCEGGVCKCKFETCVAECCQNGEICDVKTNTCKRPCPPACPVGICVDGFCEVGVGGCPAGSASDSTSGFVACGRFTSSIGEASDVPGASGFTVKMRMSSFDTTRPSKDDTSGFSVR